MLRTIGWICLLGGTTLTAAGETPRVVAGPLFALTADEQVVVWVQLDRADVYPRLRATSKHPTSSSAPSGQFEQPFQLRVPQRSIYTSSVPARLFAGGRWDLKILQQSNGATITRLALPNLPVPGAPGRFKIAFGSCSHQERFETQPIWQRVLKERPDCFLFIGDNIYAPNRASDYPRDRDAVVALFRDLYDKNRQVTELQRVLRTTYSMALWDDHDFGPNNSDRTWKWADVALQTLGEYFPNRYGTSDARGCFHSFFLGDVQVFMLDNRAFRDRNKDPERKTFLGELQLAWLKDGLRKSTAPVKLIVAGNQMLADTHPHESWGIQFRDERDGFLNWLWSEEVDGVVFLSGDRHFAELANKKDPTGGTRTLWELTSSPLANSHYEKGGEIAYPDRVASYNDGVNFGLVEIDTTGAQPKITLNIIDVGGNRVISQPIHADE